MIVQLAVLAGAGVGLGLVLTVREVWPSPYPDLGAALQRLDGHTGPPVSAETDRDAASLPERLVGPLLVRAVAGRVRIPGTNLRLIGQSPARFVATKVAMALAGVAFAPLAAGILALAGTTPPFVLPALVSLLFGVVLFWLPDLDLTRRAGEARREFQRAVCSYTDLVALERAADSGPLQALEDAAAIGESWVFVRVRDALLRAQLAGKPPWDGLRELAEEIEVPELGEVADIIRTTGEEGTAVYETLLARAEALRTEILTCHQARANADSERMIIPVALLGLMFIALLAYPVFIRIVFG